MNTLTISYVYNNAGVPEYAVIPFYVWKQLQPFLQSPYTEAPKPNPEPFEPANFRGIFSPLNLKIEQEINEMRQQWNKNI